MADNSDEETAALVALIVITMSELGRKNESYNITIRKIMTWSHEEKYSVFLLILFIDCHTCSIVFWSIGLLSHNSALIFTQNGIFLDTINVISVKLYFFLW